MRIRSLRLIAAVGAMAIPAGAVADPAHHHWEVDGFGGGHYFSEDGELGARDVENAPAPEHSVAFGVRLGFWLTPRLAIEAEGAAMPTEAKAGSATSEQFIVGYRLSGVLQFDAGRVKPFLLVGGGGESNSSERDDILLDDTDLLFHAGVGAKFALGEAWGIRADARLLLPPSSESEGVTADFEGLIGLYKLFGGSSEPVDLDSDGIIGAADRCPNEPEDKDQFQDDDGCPDTDNDSDGVADANDRCPGEPETVNQVDDNDGCPEKDEDGDGVFGAADQCPTEAEDVDGFEDGNGCPDGDNDGDGLADGNDRCPAEPETKNGFKDEDGCPDEVPVAVQKFTGTIKGINFQVNSADLTPGSSATLDEAVKVLQEYADIRLEIGGHTDNNGPADYNRRLSQRRADKVKSYFVDKGIAADRLEAKGYGPDNPLADNATREGRVQNRRVEFTLLTTGGAAPSAPPATTPPSAPAPQPSTPAQPSAPAPQPEPTKKP
jgi:OOP family OmpA-OmpF porin